MRVRPISLKTSDERDVFLSLDAEYEVLEISCSCYRVLTDPDTWPIGNEPVLYESHLFEVTDEAVPEFWVTEYEDGERYSYPPTWKGYLFEEYFDKDRAAHKIFWDGVKRFYPWTWRQRFGS